MGTEPSGQRRLLWEMSDYPVNQMYLELLREMLQSVIGQADAMPAPLASGYESLWVMQHVRPTA
jgi:hypothetical protein